MNDPNHALPAAPSSTAVGTQQKAAGHRGLHQYGSWQNGSRLSLDGGFSDRDAYFRGISHGTP
jgi:hypothetical protein